MLTFPAAPSHRDSGRKHVARGTLRARVVSAASLPEAAVDSMYELYARNYLDSTAAIFRRDLSAKTHVLLLENEDGELRGFSTLLVYRSFTIGEAVRVIYSGDTIVDPEHWGSPALALEWLRFAGVVWREEPAVPLFWLLIVKGHRTYRFLPTFAKHYLPHHGDSGSARERGLLDSLAKERFGSRFEQSTGIVRFDSPQGRLTAELAEIPARHRRLPAVAYFLARNPGYRDGHELVCLCELAPSNLKPLALRAFEPPGVPAARDSSLACRLRAP